MGRAVGTLVHSRRERRRGVTAAGGKRRRAGAVRLGESLPRLLHQQASLHRARFLPATRHQSRSEKDSTSCRLHKTDNVMKPANRSMKLVQRTS